MPTPPLFPLPEPSAPTPAERLERRLLDWLMPEGTEDLELRLFRGLTLLGGLLAFFVILPLNQFQHLFPAVNLLVALLGAASLLLHWAARRGHAWPGVYFLVLLLGLDLIWFGNAGSEGSIGMFLMSASIYLAVFIRGRRRWMMLLLFLVNGCGLYLLERAFPHWVTRFPDADSRFVDLLGSFIVCNLIIILVLWVVLGSYHRERDRQLRAARALQSSEGRFRSLVEQAPVPLLLSSPEGAILGLNRAFQECLGWTSEELKAVTDWWPRAYPDPLLRQRAMEAWTEAVAGALETGEPIPPHEFRLACKDGGFRNMEIQAALIEGLWLVMFTDLTPRRAAEAALAEQERQRLAAEEAGQLGSFTWDIVRDHWNSSPVLDRLLGLPPDFAYTLEAWNGLIRPDFREPMARYVRSLLQDRKPFDQEYPVVRPLDGREIWVHGRGEIEFDAEGRPLCMRGTIQDINELKRQEEQRRDLENQVHRAQKMDSLGGLAGGVAHDMNNVLGAILALASAQQSREAEGTPAWRAMDGITQACLRGRHLVQGLLSFSRRDLAEARPLDLNGLIREQLELLQHTTLGRVRLERNLAEGLPAVLGEPSALSHALMNLCVNALDAMPEGGTLTLSTRTPTPDTVEVEVADTGCGMASEVLERATDPYFTTKPMGKGSGLGLALVYTTLKAHGGSLSLDSQPGRGTRARLILPAWRAAGAPTIPMTATPEGAQSRLQVLVVDDDPMIREALGELLGTLGHEAREAESGEAALAYLATGAAVDGVILDLNMPGLDGAATLRCLRRDWPGLPVLISTGRADQAALDLVAAHTRVALLAKPFSRRELGEALAEWSVPRKSC